MKEDYDADDATVDVQLRSRRRPFITFAFLSRRFLDVCHPFTYRDNRTKGRELYGRENRNSASDKYLTNLTVFERSLNDLDVGWMFLASKETSSFRSSRPTRIVK